MVHIEVRKKQTVELDFDETGTYPALVIKEGSVQVARIGFHPDQAELAARLLTKGAEQAQQKRQELKAARES